MSLQLSIPDSVLEAIRIPEKRVEQELLIELAIALYIEEDAGTRGHGDAGRPHG